MNRGGNQHPFSHSPRQLENGVIDITSRFLVQQQIVPPPGQNGKRLFGNQIVQFIGMNTGGVDHHLGFQAAPAGVQPPAPLDSPDPNNLGIKLKFHTVLCGVLRQGNGQGKGTDDAPGRGIQCRHGLVGNMGLQAE